MQINTMISQLAGGMLVSTEIFVVTLVFSLPLGLLIAFGRMSKNKVLQAIVKTYISIMRGTPLMLQLMVVYFGPYYLFGIKIKSNNYRLIAAMIGFVINYAAYFAEITAAASSPCRPVSMRQQSFWATAAARHFSASSCPR